jgi:hypothetical protein
VASTTGKTEVAELVLEKGVIFGDVSQPKQSVYETSATQNYLLGTKLEYGDGRVFRYARAGAVALVKALMCHGSIHRTETFEEDQTGNYPVVGDTTITVEIGTGLDLIEATNELAGGTLLVNKGSAIGDMYHIIGSKVGSTDTNLSLVIDSPIRTTWTTSTEITIYPSPWMNTLVQTEPAAAMAVGVPLVAVTADYYYWSQVKGPTPIIVDATETLVIGDLVGAPATQGTAGQVGTWVTLTKPWGHCVLANTTSAEPAIIWLDLG